jgi:aminomethyltransferase
MPESTPALRKTPLDAWHRAHGARMAGAAGWDLPDDYGDAAAEHIAVRTRAGLFDLSHLGQIEIAGGDAAAAMAHLVTSDAAGLKIGACQRSLLVTPAGTIVDQVTVHRLGSRHFLLVVDAARTAADLAWIAGRSKPLGDVVVLDTSSRYAGMAIEGPAAEDILQGLTSLPLGDLERGAFAHGEVASVRATVSRLGRAGEDGFELLAPPSGAQRLWNAVLEDGQLEGVVPVGCAAQESLRLEAGLPRCGADIDETMTVLEAGLEDLVAWGNPEFPGRDALMAQRATGPARRIAGIELVGPGAVGPGCLVRKDGAVVSSLTSAGWTPFLEKAIGLACLPAALAAPGTALDVEVQGRPVAARVVTLPFYHRREG